MPRFRAIIFDLLTALLDSWTLWGDIAGDKELGAQWRRRSLELIYASGEYRPYREIVAEAADPEFADELLRRWDELEPWPEAPAVLRDLATDHRLALVTNTSEDLARRAAAKLGVEVDLLVSAERVGFYKPRPEPYRAGMGAGRPALFVAGSPGDVPGAEAVGLPVVWHNRVGAPAAGGTPMAVIEMLDPLPGLVRGTAH
ncbi:MAG TPA: HAD family hydrolase [Solirubrobacteraceae bacterium]|nr:HAD family hydrolase [Solirubrobacteraceae bacterium]